MEKVIINASKRNVIGKQVNALRRQSQLPGVLYGPHIKATPISMNDHDTTQILNHLTSSSLVTISLEGKEYPTLVREKQRNCIKGNLIHVDFQTVSLTEKLRTHVSVELTGSAPAFTDFNAVLVTIMDEIEVECLPEDLPERIVVDISTLNNIGDGIRVRDIVLADNIRILEGPEEMLVIATAPKEEVVEEVVPEGVETLEEAAEPEVIEKGKKEEEEIETE